MIQTKANQTVNQTQASATKANATVESEVWVQPTPAKAAHNKTEGKKLHKNLKAVYRDFSVAKQKKFHEKEEKSAAQGKNNQTHQLSQATVNPKIAKMNDEIAKEDSKTKSKIMKADRVIQDVKYTIEKLNSER